MTDTESIDGLRIEPTEEGYVENDMGNAKPINTEAEVIGTDILLVHNIMGHPGMCIASMRTEDPRGFIDTGNYYIGAARPKIFLSVSYIMDIAQKLAGVPSKTEFEKMKDELQELREYRTRVEPLVDTVEAFKVQSASPMKEAVKKAAAKK